MAWDNNDVKKVFGWIRLPSRALLEADVVDSRVSPPHAANTLYAYCVANTTDLGDA